MAIHCRHRVADIPKDRYSDNLMDRWTERQIIRQTDEQTDRWTDRMKVGQIDKRLKDRTTER
jgi:hypothetical protein